MYRSDRVEDIRRLLAEGKLSERAIAQQTGVSRGMVAAVARGSRPPQPADVSPEPLAVAHRCNECGANVYPPCIACAIRAMGEEASCRGRLEVEPLGLNLRPEHDERYRRVRRRKLRDERRRQPVDLRKEAV
jgi:hypothetical protein